MSETKKLVMVTNDDSVQSNGIVELARATAKHAKAVIVAPEQPQSATALSLTFHKPIRVNRVRRDNFECYAVSGSPGDCVMVGVNKVLPRKPDLVVSGINIGDNDTFQDILASGTVAAALESAITGIPAIAFSMEVSGESMFALEYDQPDFTNAGIIAGEIIRDVLDNGMPDGAEILNVNFPRNVQPTTPIKITEVGRRKYTDKVLVRRDPRGRPYYWLFGERLTSFPDRTDAEAVVVKKHVSITPIVLKMSGPPSRDLSRLRERVEEGLQRSRRGGR
ncbi:MAG: 5'/3'-nucleotidase SurE [Nitrososphaerota archaeon]|nr:5'/3'-nucleotidase SurE [Nitrososphaerota archaeon]MDG6941925.1 5'/3'-nucleotidase SurE [Nitrososphaerota archaeon]MDG6946902.1 5'/3'-nucleotidase SurE [Nitrososphaerota archaeon]